MSLLTLAGRTDIGPESDENQDAWAASATTDGGHLLVVCDGMGGMGNGAEAARSAIEHLETLLAGGGTQATIHAALSATDKHLRTTLVDPGPGRPGCTAAVVTVRDGKAFVGWAGDSRAYHIRGGEVLARTRDHKLVEELIEAGHIDRADASRSSMSHVVTRALGGRRSDEPPHEPETLPEAWTLRQGDAILLCSDGLCDVLPDHEVGLRVAGRPAEDSTADLIEAALRAGTHDNVTVLVAVWGATLATGAGPDTPTAPARSLTPSALRAAGVSGPPPDPLLDAVHASELTGPTPRVERIPATPPRPEAPRSQPAQERSGSSWMLAAAVALVVVVVSTGLAAWWMLPGASDPPTREAPR